MDFSELFLTQSESQGQVITLTSDFHLPPHLLSVGHSVSERGDSLNVSDGHELDKNLIASETQLRLLTDAGDESLLVPDLQEHHHHHHQSEAEESVGIMLNAVDPCMVLRHAGAKSPERASVITSLHGRSDTDWWADVQWGVHDLYTARNNRRRNRRKHPIYLYKYFFSSYAHIGLYSVFQNGRKIDNNGGEMISVQLFIMHATNIVWVFKNC